MVFLYCSLKLLELIFSRLYCSVIFCATLSTWLLPICRSRHIMPPHLPSHHPAQQNCHISITSGILPRCSSSSLAYSPSSISPEATWFIINCLYLYLNLNFLLSRTLNSHSKTSHSFSQFLNGERTSTCFLHKHHCISPLPHFVCLFVFIVVIQSYLISLGASHTWWVTFPTKELNYNFLLRASHLAS